MATHLLIGSYQNPNLSHVTGTGAGLLLHQLFPHSDNILSSEPVASVDYVAGPGEEPNNLTYLCKRSVSKDVVNVSKDVMNSKDVVNVSKDVVNVVNVYAANEKYLGDGGEIVCFRVDLSSHPPSIVHVGSVPGKGSATCHLTCDVTNKWLIAANYMSGSVVVYGIDDKNSGALHQHPACFVQHDHSLKAGHNKDRQERPHAHQVVLSSCNRFLFVPELGCDSVMQYVFNDKTGQLTPNPLTPMLKLPNPGSGPRHMCFHPNDKFAYVISEMTSQISVFAFNPETGSLGPSAVQVTSTLPVGVETGDGKSTTAAIRISKCGTRLYGSNRGHDSLTEFSVDEKNGLLTVVGHARTTPEGSANNSGAPRDFVLVEDGGEVVVLVANQNRDDVIAFTLDKDSNRLQRKGPAVISPTPVALLPL